MPSARNDGIDRTSVRNLAVSDKAVGNTQQHNEREKDSYRNPDIIPQRATWNVHFKNPTASCTDLFAQLEAAGTISMRGLKSDATYYCELVFDVNSAYFDNHGGYALPYIDVFHRGVSAWAHLLFFVPNLPARGSRPHSEGILPAYRSESGLHTPVGHCR